MIGRLMVFLRAYLETVVDRTIQLQSGMNQSQRLQLGVSPEKRSELTTNQSRTSIQLQSIFSIVLSCVLSHITAATASLPTIYQSHQIIEFLIKSKPDVYDDILYVIAYTTHSATRYKAISLLSTFWPKSIGHLMVGTNFPRHSYKDDVYRHDSGENHLPPLHDMPHEWIPWRFPGSNRDRGTSSALVDMPADSAEELKASRNSSNDSFAGLHNCLRCGKLVKGFGLKCVANHEPVHLQCLTSVENIFQIYYKTDQGTKIGQPCFSQILPNKRTSLFHEKHDASSMGRG
ncbi:hypothetical protein CROQUDRAFT_625630 [Cronartium quercuum f. sp. fusiforme G11]|uniref:Uncharacterized protein n=1 Tax=Cronartium quercuum f. sp. fusiforme G11 TaxID=708437 RepID=A0A9P6NHQ3_9BASI|nr:hypothetical protein CROQUDRAFT_625630 [Cronartium quercuum f. sp. fusiforme G11]